MNALLRRYPWWVLALAFVGACLLVVVAWYRWGGPSDEHAYWLAARRLLDGQPLYDPTAPMDTYPYLYPPPLAQVLVPVAAVVPSVLFDWIWVGAMLVALWWLAGRDVIRALAIVAFPPVAVEFWFRNVHLFLAVLIVLGLRRWAGWFSVGAAIKIGPGLGIPYLALRGRWRPALIAAGVGLAMLVVSVVLSPGEWSSYLSFLGALGPGTAMSFIPVPFVARLLVGLVLLVVASRMSERSGAILFVVAFTVAQPSLWFTGLSSLAAIVPLWRAPDHA